MGFQIINEDMKERYDLSLSRIKSMDDESTIDEKYRPYFKQLAKLILEVNRIKELLDSGAWFKLPLEEKSVVNKSLYQDILEENYSNSYACPSKCVGEYGEEIGHIFSLLYYEIRAQIAYVFDRDLEAITISNELFIQVYNSFEQDQLDIDELNEIIYWYASDYCDVFLPKFIKEQLDSKASIAKDIIMHGNLMSESYLYDFGEYITDIQIKTSKHLQSLPKERVDQIAKVIVEGFRVGFINTGKDLSKKKTVNVQYVIGFEIIVKRVVELFQDIGIDVSFYRSGANVITKRKHLKSGYYGASANKQYDYDHKDDAALFTDKKFLERKLDVTKNAYEELKELASVFAGPAVIEMFGETPFTPLENTESIIMNEEQKKLGVSYASKGVQLVNNYINPEERSYTIIAFPTPEIGDNYKEVFDAIVEVNTLDAKLYEEIQQVIIDALDQGDYVIVKGKDDNKTNLTIQLQQLEDKNTQTGFENCVADVNIPVGEVFTSPLLTGTTGTLHVSKVFLRELQYENLLVEFEDGKIIDYSCTNFEDEKVSKTYVKENVLYNRDWLPMGEFAIGTNTTAYEIAKKYDIEDKLPILIAEKMGPHFAVGDTCYSWAEDIKVYNPNGKEIIAKDNEITLNRKTDVEKAYFQCHTDITIPYEEIKEISVCTNEGDKVLIIKDGRFVLPGTEELNIPLDRMKK